MSGWRALGQALAGALGAILLTECGLRLRWGGSTAQLPIYTTGEAGIATQPGAGAQGRMHSGQRYAVQIDARGLRAPAPPAPRWLLAGDSLPFGLGVAGDEAVSALLTAGCVPTASAGVPAYSVADALAHVAGRQSEGIVVLPNAIDDDRQGASRLAEEHDVVGGRLLRKAAPPWARAFYASPLAAGQLPTAIVRLVSLLSMRKAMAELGRPRWVTDEDGGASGWAAVGALIRQFKDEHPTVSVRVAWIPLPAVAAPGRDGMAPSGRVALGDGGWSDDDAVEGLADGLGAAVIDLRQAFEGRPDAYLHGDAHLSPAGHRLLAEQLCPHLSAGQGEAR